MVVRCHRRARHRHGAGRIHPIDLGCRRAGRNPSYAHLDRVRPAAQRHRVFQPLPPSINDIEAPFAGGLQIHIITVCPQIPYRGVVIPTPPPGL
jgi:hypothetical protein